MAPGPQHRRRLVGRAPVGPLPTGGPSDRRTARRWPAVLLVVALLAVACSQDEPELTMAQRLASVEGRELSPEELADKLAVGSALCQMDEPVLDAIWRQLNERQLNFQDVVFGQICPERSVFYAGRTGRYVTEEATESGVVTSTTKPPLTTNPPVTTIAPATIAPTPTEPGSTADGDPSITESQTTAVTPPPDGPESTVSATTAPPGQDSPSSAATGTSTTTTSPSAGSSSLVEGEGG